MNSYNSMYEPNLPIFALWREKITLRSNECTARRLEKELDLLLEMARMKCFVA